MDKYFVLLSNKLVFLVLLYTQINVRKFNSSNIILGVKVPEDETENKELDLIYSNYNRMLIITGILFALIFTSVGLLLDISSYVFLFQALFVALLFLVRLIYNRKVRELKYRKKWDQLAENSRVIDIEYTRERADVKGLFSWAKIPSIIVLANLILGIYIYPELPFQISVLWGFSSKNPYVYKSLWNVFSGVFLQIFIIALVYINYYAISKSRPEIDPNNPKDSIEINKEYVNKWSNILLGNLIVITLILSYFNMYVFGFVRINSIFLYLYKFLMYGIIIVNLYMVSKFKMENMVPTVDEIKARQYYMEDDKY